MAIFSAFRIRCHFRFVDITFHIVFFVISNKEGKLLKRGINKENSDRYCFGKGLWSCLQLRNDRNPSKIDARDDFLPNSWL